MRRLVAAGLLPERAGQPVKAWVHISLADLMVLDADSALQDQWTEHVRAQWAARRAFASETGSEGGAWLDGDAAEAIACDAAMAPIVTGDVNVDALEDLVRLCVELDARRRDSARDAAWAALEQAVIGKAVDLLSGRAGWRLPTPSATRRASGRAEPAAGHRVRRDGPGGHPQRGHPARPALPVGRRAATSPRRRVKCTTRSTRSTAGRPSVDGLRAPVPHSTTRS